MVSFKSAKHGVLVCSMNATGTQYPHSYLTADWVTTSKSLNSAMSSNVSFDCLLHLSVFKIFKIAE